MLQIIISLPDLLLTLAILKLMYLIDPLFYHDRAPLFKIFPMYTTESTVINGNHPFVGKDAMKWIINLLVPLI
jgi:hypothetical protein